MASQSWARSNYIPLKVAEVTNMKDEGKLVVELGNEIPEVRKAVMDAVDNFVSEKKLPILTNALSNSNTDVRLWAIQGLRKLTNIPKAIKIVENFDTNIRLLKQKLTDAENRKDYEEYNNISNALYKLDQPEGIYIYKYVEMKPAYNEWIETKSAEGHYNEGYDDPYYGHQDGSWVEDSPAEGYSKIIPAVYEWEKHPRSDTAMISVTNKQIIPHDRIKNALVAGVFSIDSIQDSRLQRFFEFLQQKGINDLVVFGGAIRDCFLGRGINDIDFTVKIDTKVSGGYLGSIYEQADRVLERLSQSFNIPKSRFFDQKNPPQFEGVILNYLGPTKLNGHDGRELVVSRSFFNKNSGEMVSSFTTPEILSFGMDDQGRLYGYKEALKNWDRGIARLRGDPARRNLPLRSAAKLLRLKHELGLSITFEDYQYLKGVPKNQDSGHIINNYLQDDLKKFLLLLKIQMRLVRNL